MTRELFGTDGVRGKSNIYPMTAEMALKLGIAAGVHFKNSKRPRVVIGKDTRLSGYMIESALQAGFTSLGMDVFLLGPIPTPAVAMVAKSMRADLGVMISASHNPYYDNGIKLFGPDGYKLSDEIEVKIEELMLSGDLSIYLTESDNIGRAKRVDDVFGRYIEFVKSSFPTGLLLDGMKIVLDCANGAGYKVAPMVLEELGAEVITIGVSPNGKNINKNCGATATDFLCEEVVKHGADIGLALDGDGDRIIVSDENGKKINGDQIIALVGKNLHDKGLLKNNGVVATVLSNMGMEEYLNSYGIDLIRSKVGDRYVMEDMKKGGYNVGGEESGHIILSDYATTGDGLMAALQVCAIVVQSGKKASEVLNVFKPYPLYMNNVKCKEKSKLDAILLNEDVVKSIDKGNKMLDGIGRTVIRKSGTEPLIRVLAEAKDEKLMHEVIELISNEIIKVNEVI
jgi:phosphoglucosamine mutase